MPAPLLIGLAALFVLPFFTLHSIKILKLIESCAKPGSQRQPEVDQLLLRREKQPEFVSRA